MAARTRVLVCGSRNWRLRYIVEARLDSLLRSTTFEVIEGGQRGADTMARDWALANGVWLHHCPAEWSRLGPKAGPKRNSEMMDLDPDIVIAFHDNLESSRGTADMVDRARKWGARLIYRVDSDNNRFRILGYSASDDLVREAEGLSRDVMEVAG